jgi:hypothetical protein
MIRENKHQKDLFLDMSPSERRLPEAEKGQVKALLGELMVSVLEAEHPAVGRREHEKGFKKKRHLS